MKRTPQLAFLMILFLFSSLLSGCGEITVDTASNTNFNPQRVGTGDCGYGGEIKSVEAVDQFTVRFTLCEPDAAFASKISSPIFAIQDESVLEATAGDSAVLSASPVGTGAYRLASWIPEEEITLEASTSYWGVPPITTDLIFRWHADPAIRYGFSTYQSVSGIDQPSIALIPLIKKNETLQRITNIPMNLYYLGFNNQIAPFDQPEVRKAFALALDRESMVLQAFPEGSELAQQVVPSNVQPGRSLELRWYEKDTRQASDLLRSINFDRRQEITLAVMDSPMQYVDSPLAVAEWIKSELEAINIKVAIKKMAPEEFIQSVNAGKEMMYFYYYEADYGDGAAFFERPFIREANLLGSPYEEIQQKTVQALASSNAETRQQTFDELNQLVKDQVPLIPLGHAAHITIFRQSIRNVVSNSYFENFEDMISTEENITFIGKAEPASLSPADEDDYTTFRITRLIYDTLLVPGFDNNALEPLLAESWSSNSDLTEWTFLLRFNVKFSNKADFDANDVVVTFSAIWDAEDPNHRGRTGDFALYQRLFGNLLNAE